MQLALMCSELILGAKTASQPQEHIHAQTTPQIQSHSQRVLRELPGLYAHMYLYKPICMITYFE